MYTQPTMDSVNRTSSAPQLRNGAPLDGGRGACVAGLGSDHDGLLCKSSQDPRNPRIDTQKPWWTMMDGKKRHKKHTWLIRLGPMFPWMLMNGRWDDSNVSIPESNFQWRWWRILEKCLGLNPAVLWCRSWDLWYAMNGAMAIYHC